MENKMEVLSEIKWPFGLGLFDKPENKKEPKFLEEQIRDQVPTDTEEEKDEKI
jgi:hypothetical protein|tara:strand:+ start:1483 stop:1641 length:159 start_codon:yes stop_codon:yes gene_type:complete